jgi:hypothetical protein
MNPDDGSWHCIVHGLLHEEDVRATLSRAGMDPSDVDGALSHPLLTWRSTATFVRLVEAVATRFRRLRCVAVQ